ncbi:unknown function [Vibrio phage D479]
MKKFLVILLAVVASATATAGPVQCKYGQQFDEQQWYTIRSAYISGWLVDMKWSLAAIAIQESSAGKKLINNRTKDYGVFQSNIKTAMKRLQRWERAGRDFGMYDVSDPEHVKILLLNDSDIATSLAIEELTFWKAVRNNDWKQIWASYNGGYYMGKDWQKYSENYSNNITKIIRKLKTCEADLNEGLY